MSAAVEQLAPTAVEGDEIAFRLADPEHALPGGQGVVRPRPGRRARPGRGARRAGSCGCRCPTSTAWSTSSRSRPTATADLRLDPGNPPTVDGAFGEHSWLPMPGYAPPAWLDLPSVDGGTPSGHGRRAPRWERSRSDVWAPADAAPGSRCRCCSPTTAPRWTQFAGLTHYVGALIGDGRLPRMRVALLSPGARNPNYSANPAYAAALTDHVLPRLREVLRHPPAPGAERAEPGRPGGAARGVDVAGRVRRAAAPVRLVLHPRAGPAGVGLRALRGGHRLRALRPRRDHPPPRARRG